jgi:hypothetical protein
MPCSMPVASIAVAGGLVGQRHAHHHQRAVAVGGEGGLDPVVGRRSGRCMRSTWTMRCGGSDLEELAGEEEAAAGAVAPLVADRAAGRGPRRCTPAWSSRRGPGTTAAAAPARCARGTPPPAVRVEAAGDDDDGVAFECGARACSWAGPFDGKLAVLSSCIEALVAALHALAEHGEVVVELVERPGARRHGRCAPSTRRTIRPASLEHANRCREIAGCEIGNGAASSVTVASPRASRARIARRVGSASAANLVSRPFI